MRTVGVSFGFHFTPVAGNKVARDSQITGAGSGLANVPCQI